MTASETTRTLEQRVREIEARAAIDELIARYGFTIDNRDVDGMAECFTEDAVVRSSDGVMNASGRDAVIDQYHGRFTVLGPSNHFTHDRIIRFDDEDADRAYGLVNAHAEVTRNDIMQLASIRYEDEYRRDADGRWRFRERVLSFLYYCSPEEYASILSDRLRIKTYGESLPAGWPEQLETWQRYYQEHPRSK